MTHLEWEIYKEWFTWLVNTCAVKPNGFIYLKTTPETCFNRLQKRARSEESQIPLSYLQTLNQKHEDWLLNKTELPLALHHVPVLTLDCTMEFETDPIFQAEVVSKIDSFISTLQLQSPTLQSGGTSLGAV